MKKPFIQSIVLRLLYKGICQPVLKLFVGVGFSDNRFLKEEKQFIILANHNSHLDTLSLLASIPGDMLWKVKPVAAEDYFGNTKLKASFSNYFINTLLIRRKVSKEAANDPIHKMIDALNAGYSLILFPEGTRGEAEHMDKIKSGIGRVLAACPKVKYVPVFMTGMGKSLPKGNVLILPYKAGVYYGKPALANSTDVHEIVEQIQADFDEMKLKYSPPVEEDDD